jgi:leader peptidase (prepilin peptidase)/N-methyltransferase
MRFDFPLWILIPYLFGFGAVIGSFLNVCIYRLPKSEGLLDQVRGLWSPPSHCPRCRRRILLKDNIPVIGWLLLRGRCRSCRLRIAARYPLIETLNGLLFVVFFLCEVPTGWTSGLQNSCVYSPLGPQGDLHSVLFSPVMVAFWRWLVHMVLVECLVVATFIDFDLRIIPDGATIPAILAGLIGGAALGCVHIVPVWFQDPATLGALGTLFGEPIAGLLQGPPVPAWIPRHPHLHGLAVSLAGIVVGGGSIWIVRIIGHLVLKREAMGFGDVVLMAAIGSVIGWQPVLLVFFLAPLCALVVVAISWFFRGDREIPYGPYLSLATLVVLLGWQEIWPSAERIFALGPFVPALGIVMTLVLFITLHITQLIKRLLGIADDFSDEEDEWESADQLFHFTSHRRNDGHAWKASEWPGIRAARGSLFEQRWRGDKGR